MGEPFTGLGFPQLGIWKGEPDLFHLTGLKIGGEAIDLGAEKGGVGNIFLQAFLAPM